ncbi:MAG: DUF4301 family protein [Bacteroidota bacterium]
MFSEKNKIQIESQGSTISKVEKQIQYFVEGFPYMPLKRAAIIGDGIVRLSDRQIDSYKELYTEKSATLKIVKFVPASGAASRMFKSLFAALEEGKFDKSVDQFFERLEEFAFAEELKKIANNEDKATILKSLLTDEGLGYGSLPKGLLAFHQYPEGSRTPVEEHLVEGANYANSNGKVYLHLTVSPEHKSKFQDLLASKLGYYEKLYNLSFDISYSEQKSSTDTIAVNLDNTPFLEADGSLLFRPAGHGALLENLNEIEADIIFIKNIDNVVPDRIKEETFSYKKALAGLILEIQSKVFGYLNILKYGSPTLSEIDEIDLYLQKTLCIEAPNGLLDKSSQEQAHYYFDKLNRPIRICGMVKNQGEPGGGPFWCKNSDGTSSLQVVESAQVDLKDPAQKEIFTNSTHFNPVDLVCATKDFEGNKFNLMNYSDPKTGFNTEKSKDGKSLKAQELPGLWNGSMADWNTIFVEVPLITFNPVKTINDLLREEHQ